MKMFIKCLVLLTVIAQDCLSQDEDEGPYRGKLIGKLNSYHHQVSGEVYAIDDWTLLLVNFNYDGNGDDTYFWAGDSGRPGPQGFIVPDQHGKTNVLERHYNEEVRLTLPEGKRISRLKWVAVYDIATQNAFGDVYVPDEFDAPSEQTIGPLTPLAGSTAVSSGPLRILDANTILIPEFRYDGSGEEVYFWTGVGPQPSAKGSKIPDEYGYLESIRQYRGEEVTLQLVGGQTVFSVHWVCVWDSSRGVALAAATMPDALNVPPAATLPEDLNYRSSLPNCKQLHRDYQVSWEVFGNQVTFQLAARVGERDYMAFGISGSRRSSRMLGADVAVTRFDARLRRPLAVDYNITDLAPCVQVLGRWRGVCRDDQVGGQDSYQVLTGERRGSLTVLSYRRSLQPGEPMDLEWRTDGPTYAVWALGPLDHADEPSFHSLYHKRDLTLHLTADPPVDDCFPFASPAPSAPAVWETAELFDPALRVFTFMLGPAGGRRGVSGRAGGSAPPLAWYVNGQLAPALQLRRGLRYSLRAAGGDDPRSPTLYHPLVVTRELVRRGGLERLSDAGQRAAAVHVLAGVRHTRRGRLEPTAAGGLCVGRHAAGADRRRDDDFPTFRAYNRSLVWSCSGAPADLTVTPNSSWPDIVYYNSFTHAGMGGRIYIVDKHKRTIGRQNRAASLSLPHTRSLALAIVSLALTLARL